jgi:hypothetical protein
MKITDNTLITMNEHLDHLIYLYGEDDYSKTFRKVLELLSIIKEDDKEKLDAYVETIPSFWMWDLNDLILTYMNGFQRRYYMVEDYIEIIEQIAKQYGEIRDKSI